MRKLTVWCVSFCSVVVLCGCASDEYEQGSVSLTVVDVGQGLAQIVSAGGSALAVDMGPGESSGAWLQAWKKLGSPRLELVVLSHTDEDHAGGMHVLSDSVAFSGLCVIGFPEDSARVIQFAGDRGSRLTFRRIAAGDTIGSIRDMYIECLWPPREMEDSTANRIGRNNCSIVLKIVHGGISVLLTGDIDTTVTRCLSSSYSWRLRSDILIVPHHASAGGADRVFYGFVRPNTAVISCARLNTYGHPAPEILDICFEMGINVFLTYDGTVQAMSNQWYWVLHDEL